MTYYYKTIRNFLLSCIILCSVFAVTGESSAKCLHSIQQKKSKKNDKTAAVLNSKGNSFFAKAIKKRTYLDSAIVYYQKAIKKAPKDPGLKFNLGIALFAKGKTKKAESNFKKGYSQCKNNRAKAFKLLSINPKKPQNNKSMNALSQCLEESFSSKSKAKKKKKKNEEKKTKSGGDQSADAKKKNKDKKQTKPAGPKTIDLKVLQNHLYKKKS